ncbi:MAG TPA: FAD-dependent oxidoreductase, partial [Pirellulaceae bacterium]|nr:FAD-dependent oxidoreductase [Pirellulaceae bacterium]
GNLLVAGKTMAQTFLANSATRLHPIDWSTGTAAAHTARKGWTTRQLLEHVSELQPPGGEAHANRLVDCQHSTRQ